MRSPTCPMEYLHLMRARLSQPDTETIYNQTVPYRSESASCSLKVNRHQKNRLDAVTVRESNEFHRFIVIRLTT